MPDSYSTKPGSYLLYVVAYAALGLIILANATAITLFTYPAAKSDDESLPDVFDCYVLSPVRSAVLAARFPDYFMPGREASFDMRSPSEVPGVPAEATFDELCTYLALNETAEFSFCWHSTEAEPWGASLIFNSDGSLIFGLTVASPESESDTAIESSARPWIERLRRFASRPPTIFGSEFPLPLAIWGAGIAPPKRTDFED